MKRSVGLDIGHSAVKCRARFGNQEESFIFPSVVCNAFHISDEAEARRATSDTVKVGGKPYFVGDTAQYQSIGKGATGLTDDWIDSPQHEALFLAAINKLRERGLEVDSSTMLVLGLPSSLFDKQRNRLKVIAARHTNAIIKVLPQPMGVYHGMMLDGTGMSEAGRSPNESWGVVEVGHYTTDFMLTLDGRWVEQASGSCSGLQVATTALQKILSDGGIQTDLSECQQIMREGHVRNFNQIIDAGPYIHKAVETIVDEVVDTAERLMAAQARKLNGVMVAGGGGGFVFESLKKRWPHALLASDPRFSVAEGFCRLGLGILNMREAQLVAVQSQAA